MHMTHLMCAYAIILLSLSRTVTSTEVSIAFHPMFTRGVNRRLYEPYVQHHNTGTIYCTGGCLEL